MKTVSKNKDIIMYVFVNASQLRHLRTRLTRRDHLISLIPSVWLSVRLFVRHTFMVSASLGTLLYEILVL